MIIDIGTDDDADEEEVAMRDVVVVVAEGEKARCWGMLMNDKGVKSRVV